MKNKYELKKCLTKILIFTIISLVSFTIISHLEYKHSIKVYNKKIENIISIIKDKYPNITDNEIIEILNNEEKKENNFFEKYSINKEEELAIKDLSKNSIMYIIINLVYITLSISIIIIIFLNYNKKKDNNIDSITKYIEEINKKNYKLDLDSISEDELSILKNEIYKTTIMLKEQAENSKKDKLLLKNSLSDISHQLKTPLTSIMILLDNLIDNPDMDKSTREDFIKDIKIEITNINFLVQSILKLSKLDSNTIEFNNKEVSLSKLINKSTKKLLSLCDLKNIKLKIELRSDGTIICDETWQSEAISNIIKNCIEHSLANGIVKITIDQNKAYSIIEIKDYGKGINKQDLNHIFERFYKGKNSTKDSIGIGLSLAKTIIETNNGKVSVTSIPNKETTFTIKYFK